MANLEKLIADHAYWSDKRRDLKAAGSMRFNICTGVTRQYHPPIDCPSFAPISSGYYTGPTCLEKAREIFLEYQNDSKTYHCTYDDAFNSGLDESGEAWEPCEHCVEVRRLKAERVKASRKLGGIRAAMTRVGRTLNDKGGK